MDKPSSNKKIARTAGLLYLIVVVAGIFSLAYVPSQITAVGDAAATAGNIMASMPLFRLGIVAGLICFTAFLLLPLALYRLLGRIDRNAAILMVVLAVASVPISFVNMLNKLDVLSLLSGADYLRVFTADQLHARVMLSLDSYGNGLLVSKIFWGLWLLPFGYLVYRSGILPRIFGILLMMGCFGYLIDFTGRVLFPGYVEVAIARFVTLPGTLGEIGICLWLLIMGAREYERRHSTGTGAN
ncbi:MAG: DUF4386 domain-containing protein [Sphingomonadaceae bacterium]